MNANLARLIYTLIYSAPAILIGIVFHEVAHAAMSYACGDKMVKADGRLSLNPFKHLDWAGTLCLLLFHMGWAKPVRVNTRAYKHKKLDFCLVALAGPVMNFVTAFAAMVLMYLAAQFMPYGWGRTYLANLCYYITVINVGLGVFNLIPIPPLDGSNVLLSVLPDSVEAAISPYRKYMPLILLALLYFSPLSELLSYVNLRILNHMWSLVRGMFGAAGGGMI